MVEQNSHEEARSPRERIARIRTIVGRGFSYWKGSLLLLLLGGAVAIVAAMHAQRVYRSECTVFAKPRIRTDERDDSGTSPEAMARQAARLKDMLTTRGRLESAIKTFHLYPETLAGKTMLDAVEQMKPHVGFRALEGAQYVISFDGNDPDAVKDVTQYLSDTLIGDYASGDLDDLKQEADFLAQEEERSLTGLEEATKALTIFLADHPEFALEAKQAAQTPFGPSPNAGIPLMPKLPRDAAAITDPELAALYRERSRLEGEVRSAAAIARGLPPGTASSKQLDEQIVQAQVETDAAAKRVAETQADLASKSNLTEDHPDMRAARLAADAAARRLHEAKVQLAALQQLKASGAGASLPDASHVAPEIAEKLKQVDAQILARRAQVKPRPASAARSADPEPSSSSRVAVAAPSSPVVSAVVELETDWQRLLRALNDAKSRHDDVKTRTERAKLALEAARAQASERMAILDPPFRPTHPSKGGRTNAAITGMALALLLAIAYATVRVTLDDRLIDADDVRALGVTPVLGVVPRLEAAPSRSSKEAHDDAAA
jgi:hypothetical protein